MGTSKPFTHSGSRGAARMTIVCATYLPKASVELILLPAVRRHWAGSHAFHGVFRGVRRLRAEFDTALTTVLAIFARVVPALPELERSVQAVARLGERHGAMTRCADGECGVQRQRGRQAPAMGDLPWEHTRGVTCVSFLAWHPPARPRAAWATRARAATLLNILWNRTRLHVDTRDLRV